MKKDNKPFDVKFLFWGGEEKGKPGASAFGLVKEHVGIGCILGYREGRTLPWVVQEGAIDILTKEFRPHGRPRCFKTKPNAEKFIHAQQQAETKAQEKRIGALPVEARTPGQKELKKARIKAVRKWFPDTTAIQEQIGDGERTAEQDQACRKALAADLVRLRRTVPKEILEGIPLSPDLIADLGKAENSANPLDLIEEELLNWEALYSEDLPNVYADKIRKKTGSKISDGAIKRRVYRGGFRVAEKYQKPKPKPQ